MHEVEVELPDERDQQHEDDEPHRVGAQLDERHVPVGEGPQGDDLVGRPDRHAAAEGPEDVVRKLIVEREDLVVPGERAERVLGVRALRLEDVEPQVPGTEEEHREPQVAGKDDGDPPQLERLHVGKRRSHVEPRHQGEREEESVPRPEIARPSEEELQDLDRLERPCHEDRLLDDVGRPPVATLIAHTEGRIRHRSSPGSAPIRLTKPPIHDKPEIETAGRRTPGPRFSPGSRIDARSSWLRPFPGQRVQTRDSQSSMPARNPSNSSSEMGTMCSGAG